MYPAWGLRLKCDKCEKTQTKYGEKIQRETRDMKILIVLPSLWVFTDAGRVEFLIISYVLQDEWNSWLSVMWCRMSGILDYQLCVAGRVEFLIISYAILIFFTIPYIEQDSWRFWEYLCPGTHKQHEKLFLHGLMHNKLAFCPRYMVRSKHHALLYVLLSWPTFL